MGSYLVWIAYNTSADVCEAVLASSSDNITHTDLHKCEKVTDLHKCEKSNGHFGGVLDLTRLLGGVMG